MKQFFTLMIALSVFITDCTFAQGPGAALHFDGVNDYVSGPATGLPLGNMPRTIEFWMNEPQNGNYILAGWGGGQFSPFNGCNLIISNGYVALWGSGTYFVSASTRVPANTWTHVAMTWDGTTLNFYINGSPAGSFTSDPATSLPILFSTNLNYYGLDIGKEIGGVGDFYEGSMDELRVWNVARTQTQIAGYMNCEINDTPCELKANFHFNQGVASGNNTSPAINTLDDQSLNNNDATLYNYSLDGGTSNWITPGGVTTGTSCTAFPPLPEINVQGNSISIVSGDATPTTTDNTDFGSITLGGSTTQTFSIENTGAETLNISAISFTGTNTSDFSVVSTPSIIAAGSSQSITVNFTPTALGIRTAVLRIANDDCDESDYYFTIKGTGACSAASFSTCPSNLTENTASGECTAVVSYTATANGTPAATVSYDFTGATVASGSGTGSGSTFNKGTTSVTLTASNGCGSTATCTFTVTVSDNQAPTLTCPGNQMLNVLTGSCTADYTINDPISDNCTGATWGFTMTGATSGTVNNIADGINSNSISFNKGVTTVTLTGTDGTNAATDCVFTVTVQDNIPPVITCPSDVTIYTTVGQCTGTTTLTPPTVNDNCSETRLGNGLNYNGVSDYVTIDHSSLPSFTGPFTVEAWVYLQPTSELYPTVFSKNSDNLAMWFQGGTVSGIWSLSVRTPSGDVLGGSVSENTWVHVALTSDGTTKKLYINGDMVASNPIGTFNTGTGPLHIGLWDQGFGRPFKGSMDEFRIWDVERTQAQIADNMDNEIGPQANLVSYLKLNEGVAGGNNAGLTTAADASGNNAFGTLNNFALSGNYSNWVTGYSSTNPPVITNDAPDTYLIGNTTVTWTATDASGNTATCTQTVTVVDNEAPTLTCPGNQMFNLLAGSCTADYTIDDPISDNCTGATWGYTLSGATTGTISGIADGTNSTSIAFNRGVTIVTLNGTDGTNTATTCSFTVTVNDNIAPTITCAGNVTINTTAGQCTGTTTLMAPAVSDNCSDIGNALDFDGTPSYVTLPSDVYFDGDFTIEAWVYPKEHTNWSRIIDFGNGAGSNNVVLSYTYGTSGAPGFYIEGTQFQATSALPLNQWSHVAATFKKSTPTSTYGTGTIYINGVESGSATMPVPANVTRSFNYIGRSNWGLGDPDAKATFDELRIWNVARTQSELQNAMNHELNGSEAGLQVYFNFNQGTACGDNTSITTLPNLGALGSSANATLQDIALNGGCNDNFTAGKLSSLNVTNNAPATYPIGTTTVTWTVTDGSGNTATCDQLVTVVAPEIGVSGNNLNIPDGDVTPLANDNTDFDSVYIGSNNSRTYSIENTGTSDLTISSINLTGVDIYDFAIDGISLPTTIPPASSVTFNVSFIPTAVGQRSATVVINNDDCDEADFDFAIQGRGVSPVTLTSFTPTVAGTGQTVTISGTAFTDASDVSFGGVAASSFTVINSSTIEAVVGAGASGSVSVTTPNGSASLAGFTYCMAFTVTDPTGATYCQYETASAMSVSATSSDTLIYQWYSNTTNSNSGGTLINGATSSSYTPSTAGGGITYYYVVISSTCGQTATSNTAEVIVNALPVTPIITAGSSTDFCTGGAVILTSSSVSGNQWYLNGNVISGSTNQTYSANSSGTYTVVVNANGCNSLPSSGTVVTVNQPTTSDTTAAVCNKFTWKNVTYTLSGDYDWKTTNAAGCDSTRTLHLTILSVTSTTSKTDAVCAASATGSITVNPTFGVSPFTYRIGTVGSYVANNVFTNLKAGKYTVSILDANGCAGITSQVTILQPPAQAGTISKTDALCFGTATGSVTVSPTNGTAPYTYRLGSTGSYGTSNVFTALKAGTITAFIQDANGCTCSVATNILQPAKIAATSSVTNESCPNAKNGSITINATGGTPPYTYRFGTTGAFVASNTFNGLKAGSYRIFVNDANNCSGYSILTTVGQTSPTCTASPIARGIVNSKNSEAITLSPNPTNNQFKLMLPTTDNAAAIRVLDVNGRTLYTAKTGSQSITFGENFAPGVYMVEVRQGETVKTLKAVKGR